MNFDKVYSHELLSQKFETFWNCPTPKVGIHPKSIQSFLSIPTICLCAFLTLISSCLISFLHGLSFGHEPKIRVATCDVFYTQTWRMSHNVWHACKKKVKTSTDQEWTFIINWKKESRFTWYFKNATFHEIDSIGNIWLGLTLPPLSNLEWSTTYCSNYWYITCYTTCYNSR